MFIFAKKNLNLIFSYVLHVIRGFWACIHNSRLTVENMSVGLDFEPYSNIMNIIYNYIHYMNIIYIIIFIILYSLMNIIYSSYAYSIRCFNDPIEINEFIYINL